VQAEPEVAANDDLPVSAGFEADLDAELDALMPPAA
jgi:hypothetical protein